MRMVSLQKLLTTATLVSSTPDRDGTIEDLLHGYDSVDGYAGSKNHISVPVGRFGNRIKGGKFTLDCKDYILATNSDSGGIPCHLHGGVDGFNRRIWTVTLRPESNAITYHVSGWRRGLPRNFVRRDYISAQ